MTAQRRSAPTQGAWPIEIGDHHVHRVSVRRTAPGLYPGLSGRTRYRHLAQQARGLT
jgi:hypothetical protein